MAGEWVQVVSLDRARPVPGRHAVGLRRRRRQAGLRGHAPASAGSCAPPPPTRSSPTTGWRPLAELAVGDPDRRGRPPAVLRPPAAARRRAAAAGPLPRRRRPAGHARSSGATRPCSGAARWTSTAWPCCAGTACSTPTTARVALPPAITRLPRDQLLRFLERLLEANRQVRPGRQPRVLVRGPLRGAGALGAAPAPALRRGHVAARRARPAPGRRAHGARPGRGAGHAPTPSTSTPPPASACRCGPWSPPGGRRSPAGRRRRPAGRAAPRRPAAPTCAGTRSWPSPPRATSRSTTSPCPGSPTSSPPTSWSTTPRSPSASPPTSPSRRRLPVLFFSLEMGHSELTLRILSAEARVDSQKMRTGPPVRAGLVEDRPGHRPARGAAVHRRQPERHGHGDPGQGPAAGAALRPKLGLVVVDYLQLMTGRIDGREPPGRGVARSAAASRSWPAS